MPTIDYVRFLQPRPMSAYEKTKYALLALIVANVFYQIIVSLFAMDYLVATTQKQLPRPAPDEDIRTLLIAFLVVSLLFDVLGVVGTLLESFCLVLFYAVIVTLGGIFAIASVFNGQPIVLVDVIIYAIVAACSFYFARLIRAKRTTDHETLA